jgi:UDP-N-acetylmuramate: L-alanyl-gamma-D-glutamyl-meso-diaminopimelate ligase
MQKHIHFIGICGVAMSALAIAFQKNGWRVTGSDKGFYPPVSTNLKDVGVSFYPGWHPEKMAVNGAPDMVVVGNVAGSENPEWVYVQENNIPYRSYPEVVAEYFVKKNSIVCSGTFGKSTSSILMTWILTYAGMNPSYMFGGVSDNNLDPATISDSDWSILEGDEYKSARWDDRPKFAHYSPTHLLLTAVIWDHADIYPTEEGYINTFKHLVDSIPKTGIQVLSEKAMSVVGKPHNAVTYGKSDGNDYMYSNIFQTKDGITFDIIHKQKTYHITASTIGDYMADNITGCFAMSSEIGIQPEKIIEAIATFKNIKRRLEKRYEGSITVFDDIAHSPVKAASVLETLKKLYSGNIIAVFEPNTGNRQPASYPSYEYAYNNADKVIIPRLTQIKIDPTDPFQPADGEELARIIGLTHKNTVYIENDEELVKHIRETIATGDVLIFLGSHGFRSMIDTFIQATI